MNPSATSPSAYPANALPPGTRLGEFEVLSLLGVGGFGIVYLALDHALEREVAVKEYMPAMLAGRSETLHVSLRSQSDAETFALGMSSFINEAKLLARFDHPSLVKVYRFWQANDTAYMAMPLYRGRTLKDVRQGMSASPDEAWMQALLTPLLSALEVLHAAAVYHRDIAPDNIVIEPDGRPVLLDFGAARRVISDKSQNLTAILKPQYAPIEQYADVTGARQGPWTDLYALGATLHFALAGRPPSPATSRSLFDDLEPLSQRILPGCSQHFLHCVDWMLAMRPGDRPQSVAALRAVLDGAAAVPPPAPVLPAAPPTWQHTVTQASSPRPSPATTVLVRPATAPLLPQALSAARPPAVPDPAPPPAPAAAADWPAERGLGRSVGPALAGLALLLGAGAWWSWPQAPAPQTVPAPAEATEVIEGAPEVIMPAPASASVGVNTVLPPASASAAVSTGLPAAAAVSTAAPPAAAPAPAPVEWVIERRVLPSPARPPAKLGAETPAAATAAPRRVPTDEAERAQAPQPRPAEPPSAIVKAPGATAAPAVAAAPPSDDPSAVCGKRVFAALLLCMERRCRSDALRDHPACRTWYRQNTQPVTQP
jgi:serine/threonine protein kinase